MKLDLSVLKDALESLNGILSKTTDQKFMSELDEITQKGLKAGVIQNFEFSYELAWKFIKRWIHINVSPEEATNPRTRKDLFRIAAKYHLIKDPESWFKYGEARNLTSHTYDPIKAEDVYKVCSNFKNDFKYLLQQLKKSND